MKIINLHSLKLIVSLLLIIPLISSLENVTLIEEFDMNAKIGAGTYYLSGIYTNTSGDIFYVLDDYGDKVYKMNSSFDLLETSYLPANGNDNPRELYFNESDFWILDGQDDLVYHYNLTFSYLDNFSVGVFDNGALGGNKTSFFLYNLEDSQIGVFNISGSNIYNISYVGDVIDIEYYNGFFYVLDASGEDAIHKINQSGDVLESRGVTNIGSGSVANGNLNSLTTTNGNDFWLVDYSTEKVYHIEFKDIESPTIIITYPLNDTFHTQVVTELNSTQSDNTALDSCWYSLDGGVTNTSFTCGQNVTGISSNEGSNTWIIWVNDTSGNVGVNKTTFYVDSLSPIVTITFPLNDTTYDYVVTELNSTQSDANLQSCWYSLDGGVTNTSFTCGQNITGLSPSEGVHTWNVWANDSFGNIGEDSVTFTIDTTPPIIEFKSPTESNNSYLTRSNIQINVTASDTNLANITIYLFNSTHDLINQSNSTTSPLFVNFTGLSEGVYYFNATAYDDAKNSNFTETRKVIIDTTPPQITIYKPEENEEFNYNISLPLNFSVTDTNGVDTCWFNVDNGENTTIPNCQNITFNTSDGSHTLYFFANDTFGNINNLSRSFTISLDAPAITLEYPDDNSFLNHKTNVYLNYTATDSNGISECQIWGNWTGIWHKNSTNTGITSGEQNFTIINISEEGSYIWNVWCNDTTGQGRFSANNFTFTIDTIYPVILREDISITTTVGSQTVTFNVTSYTELHCDSVWYSVYKSDGTIENNIENVSLSCNDISDTFAVLDYATYTLRVYMNDSAGNLNYTDKNFTTTSSSGGGGGGGGSPTQLITVIALSHPEPDILKEMDKQRSSLERAILYAGIYNFTNNEKKLLSDTELVKLMNFLENNYSLEVTLKDLKIWIEQYNSDNIENVDISEELVNKYNLVKKIVVVEKEFYLIPSSLSRYWLYPLGGTLFKWEIKANKNIKSCEIMPGIFKLNGNCTLITNSSAIITYTLKDFSQRSKVVEGEVRFESIDGEITYLPIRLIIYNIKSMIFPIFAVCFIIILFFIKIKNGKIYNKKNLNKILGNY